MYLRPYQESVRIDLVLVISSKIVNLFQAFFKLVHSLILGSKATLWPTP